MQQSRRRKPQHLYLDKAYNSEQEELDLIKQGLYCIFLQREKEIKMRRRKSLRL